MLYLRINKYLLFLFLCLTIHSNSNADNITYILTAREANLLKNLDRISDMVANANTTAFRAENDIFTEYKKVTSPKEKLSFTKIGRTVRDTSQGIMVTTHRQLDVAINGMGYFMLKTPFGEMYTRNGSFVINMAGVLVNHDGYPVLAPGGGQITLTEKDIDISIKENGLVKSGDEERGQIGVFTFADENLIKRAGSGLYKTSQNANIATNYTLAQGMLENSNVNSVTAMTNLVSVSRNIENITKVSSVHNDMQLDMIKRLTQ